MFVHVIKTIFPSIFEDIKDNYIRNYPIICYSKTVFTSCVLFNYTDLYIGNETKTLKS